MVFRPYLDQFIIVFIDDIPVYSKSSRGTWRTSWRLHYADFKRP